MPWLILVAAGVVEVAWALSLKPTEGFTRLWPTVVSLLLMCAAVYLLTIAVRSLPIGTAYAVFTGMGAVGTVIFGILFAGDPPTFARIGPILLVVSGVVLLRVLADG
jgi:quaternary ammonium compound-resistance protein SugE